MYELKYLQKLSVYFTTIKCCLHPKQFINQCHDNDDFDHYVCLVTKVAYDHVKLLGHVRNLLREGTANLVLCKLCGKLLINMGTQSLLDSFYSG